MRDGGGSAGPAERATRQAIWRLSVAIRAATFPVAVLPSVAIAPPDTFPLQVAAAVVVLGWSILSVLLTRRHQHPWLLVVDTLVFSGLCLLMPLLDVPALAALGIVWVRLVAETQILFLPWIWPGRPAMASATVIAAAAGAGTWLTNGGAPLEAAGTALWLLTVALGILFFREVLVRAARQVDAVTDEAEAAHREVQVARARAQAEAERLAVLHDTVAATLMMVGLGATGGDGDGVRDHARRGLAILTGGGPAGEDAEDDLRAGLQRTAAVSPLEVEVVQAGDVPELPAAVVRAFLAATGEALRNVQRHAGVRQAEVVLTGGPAGAVVEVRDQGRGLAGNAPGSGIRGSIQERMGRAGGRGTVLDRPGRGVVVRLEWSGAAPEVDDGSGSAAAAERAERLARRAVLAMSVLFGLVLLKNVVLMYEQRAVYDPAWAEWLAFGGFWLVLAALWVVRSRRLLAGAVLGFSVLASAAVPAAEQVGPAHWSWICAGWLLVAVFAGAPLRTTVVAISAHLLVCLPWLLAAPWDRDQAVGLLIRTAYSTAGQICLAWAIHLLREGADAARRIAERERNDRISRSIAERVRQDRQEQHEQLARTTLPMLRGLSSGELSPEAPEVRARSLVEAARVRRLLAEGDAAPDSLGNELGVVAELAARAGVQVDISYRGEGPEPTAEVRRRLTEPVIGVLSAAGERARITVIRGADRLVVSAVADATSSADEIDRMRHALSPDGQGLSVEWVRAEGQVWVTSSWRVA